MPHIIFLRIPEKSGLLPIVTAKLLQKHGKSRVCQYSARCQKIWKTRRIRQVSGKAQNCVDSQRITLSNLEAMRARAKKRLSNSEKKVAPSGANTFKFSFHIPF